MNKILNTAKLTFITLLFISIIAIISNIASAQEGHMTLLTVGERGNETIGGTADIFLEIKPGTGRVFIDSFPLTKIDTQISTRFAKEVACDFLEKSCLDKDFFYTIRAKSSVVGGPSAGGALTVLTIAVLENEKIDQSVVMTGTITSGGIIGPVAGIQEKVKAAEDEGFKKVLIPKRSIIAINETESEVNGTNISLTYSDSFQQEGIEVIPLSTVEDALFEFTGKRYKDYSYNLTIPEQYNEYMKQISLEICNRGYEIIPLVQGNIENFSKEYNDSLEFLKRGNDSLVRGDYYSAASFCFNANKALRTIEYSSYSNTKLRAIRALSQDEVNNMFSNINSRELKTLSELETTMVVKERLHEANKLLEGNESMVNEQLPYIVERIHSAKAWSTFFNYSGKEVELDQEHLSQACLTKIAEAEERINYLDVIFGPREDLREELYEARKFYTSEDYAFCLFKAARIKADANALLTAVSITDERFQELLDDQFKLARIQINKQGEDFPIIGYSYYDYASSLRETRPELSLIYSEYASEFSNLDMYFPKEDKIDWFYVDTENLGMFLIGLAAGMFVIVSVLYISSIRAKRKMRASNINNQDAMEDDSKAPLNGKNNQILGNDKNKAHKGKTSKKRNKK